MVNMELGICSCNVGCYGSPRSAAIVKHYHKSSVNYIPSLSADSRELVANIALGQQVIKAPPFYASLHEKTLSITMMSIQQVLVVTPKAFLL